MEKKYNEAVNKLRKLLDLETVRESGKIFIDHLKQIFPELKETEDERIRRTLADFFSKGAEKGETTNGIPDKDILVWLEKQGAPKPAEEIEPTPIFKIGDILKRKGKNYTFRVDRIQGGYYHCDHNHRALFPIKEQDNWELVEQNPAWDAEDKAMLDFAIRAIGLCRQYAINHQVNGYLNLPDVPKKYEELQDWLLKSLKPQNR